MNNPKYIFLDGVRGVAAIFVLTRHTIGFWHFRLYHSYLAVDLFFLLSGFVIAYAYEARLRSGNMSFTRSSKIRLIRLYPVYILSVAISTALWFGDPMYTGTPVDARQIWFATISSLLFLPYYLPGDINLFPANGNYWSLFFELITNFGYAGLRDWLTDRKITVIAALFGFAVVFLTLRYGNLDMGYGWYVSHLATGLSRAIFGLSLGILLYRKRVVLGVYFQGISPWASILVLCAILAIPHFPAYDALIDIVAVVLIFPICLCITSQHTASRFRSLLTLLGSASYPLYVLQVPLVHIVTREWNPIIEKFAPISGLVLVALLIVICLIVEKTFDIPLRRRLTRRLSGV